MSISLPKVTNTPVVTAKGQPPLPPTTSGWPLIGSLPTLLQQQTAFLTGFRRQYGDIYTLDLGLFKPIMLNHPAHVQYVLRDETRNYAKGGRLDQILREIFGNGLPFSEGEFWLRQRRLLQPQFHRQRLMGLTELMLEASEEGLTVWDTYGDSPINLASAFASLTVRIITRIMFGAEVSQEEIERGAAAVTYLNHAIMPAMLTRSLPSWVPVPGARKFRQAVQTIDDVVYRVIARRQQTADGDGPLGKDLISLLLDIVDDETGEPMSKQQVRDEAVTAFIAGYETTSTALTWTMALLMQHPDKLAKLQVEIDSVLGQECPTFATLTQLPYARMVLQEAMRLRPPVWWLTRTTVADDVIDGYRIPAGSTVVLPIYAIHHHPDFWEEPEKFEPERFAPEQAKQRHSFAWVPFGAGPRLCIGRDLALLEGQLILALALQRYSFTPVAGKVVEPYLASTLVPKNGVWTHVSMRMG